MGLTIYARKQQKGGGEERSSWFVYHYVGGKLAEFFAEQLL